MLRIQQSSDGSTATTPTVAVDFRYSQSESFVAVLEELGAALLVSTYQANKLLVVRAAGGGISTLVRSFDRPMGIAAGAGRLALATRGQIWHLRNAPDIAARVEPAGRHDACFLPRSCHVTGDIGIHEIAWGLDPHPPSSGQPPQEPDLWIVNTRFSCLCTLHPDYSFVPRWRPTFITRLAAEDRCHLNGLAIREGRPSYVTALGETDTRDGWRAQKPSGGCLIDVTSNTVVRRGLSMPHSPRWHDGQLWVLESGTGRLLRVDPGSGVQETVTQLPGFTRGLAIRGPHAFIGLSKIRETSAMDGVPIAERRSELKSGVAVVHLPTGRLSALLEFQTAVEEIFDVQLLPGLRFPEIIGFQKESIQHTFIIPDTEAVSIGMHP